MGAFRTGKSFLLSNFIKYLKSNKNWKIVENDINEENGFKWSYGSAPHTKGIWMWNSPIVIKSSTNGKEVGTDLAIQKA